MRIAYFDCPSGASGDMILGALLDAGLPLEALRAELRALPLPGWELRATEVRRGAFRALQAQVEVAATGDHPHRSLADVLAIVEGSGLHPRVVGARAHETPR